MKNVYAFHSQKLIMKAKQDLIETTPKVPLLYECIDASFSKIWIRF